MGFVDALRMNNIYTPSGTNSLLGPPDMNGGGGMNPNDIMQSIMHLREQAKQEDENRQYRMFNFQDTAARRNKFLDRQSVGDGTKPNQQMNTVMGQSPTDRTRMTDYQKGMLENDKAKLSLAQTTAQAKDENTDMDRNIRQQRADTYGSMHDLSDSQKLDIVNRARAGDIQARGQLQQMLEEQRQGGRESIQGMRDDTTIQTTDSRNQNNLAGIAARVAGDKEVAGYKSTLPQPMNETQQRTGNWNTAQQILNTRPDLAPFVTAGPNGQFSVQAPQEKNYFGYGGGPSADQYKELNELIYGPPAAPSGTTAKPGTTPATKPADTGKPIPNSKFQGTVTVR